ncbi:MAG: hypothetical protein ACE5JB_08070 [bacterium]
MTNNSNNLTSGKAPQLIQDIETRVKQILQFYFLRWDIEVNHRDEKSLFGIWDAQMRSPKSGERSPQFSVTIDS